MATNRDEFCEALAGEMESHDVGGLEIEHATYRGDGWIEVTLADGASFNVNVTTAR